MALSCISSAIKRDIGQTYPLAFNAPIRRSLRNISIPFGIEKLEWWGYPKMKKNFANQYNRLDTDGRTDGHLPLQSPRYAYAMRGKNQ